MFTFHWNTFVKTIKPFTSTAIKSQKKKLYNWINKIDFYLINSITHLLYQIINTFFFSTWWFNVMITVAALPHWMSSTGRFCTLLLVDVRLNSCIFMRCVHVCSVYNVTQCFILFTLSVIIFMSCVLYSSYVIVAIIIFCCFYLFLFSFHDFFSFFNSPPFV